MKKNFDTVIIGSGYTALGYVAARPNTLIIEERELADASFGAPLRTHMLSDYTPKSEECRALIERYRELGILRDGQLNAPALECGFADHAIRNGVRLYLKTRVISTEANDSSYTLRTVSNSGITKIEAGRILDLRPKGRRELTFLFTTSDDRVLDDTRALFPEGWTEPAFYRGRYALHMPIHEDGELRDVKRYVYDRWQRGKWDAMLLYTAPYGAVISSDTHNPTDATAQNPFEAFDLGLSLGREVAK